MATDGFYSTNAAALPAIGGGGGGATCVSCSAGINQSQDHLGEVSVSGSASGGSGAFTYGWKLIDPFGDDKTSGLTGSTSVTASFTPKVAGLWTLQMSASCSSGIQYDSMTTAVGNNGWIRLRPEDITYSTTGMNATNNWTDDGSSTTVELSQRGAGSDLSKPSNMSVRGFSTGIDMGSINTMEFMMIPTGTIPTITEQFIAGWMWGPQFDPADTDQAGSYALIELCQSWSTERYTIRKLVGGSGGESAFSWLNATTDRQQFYVSVAVKVGLGQLNKGFIQVMNLDESAETDKYMNLSDTTEAVYNIPLKLNMLAGRMKSADGLVDEFNAKWYYKLGYRYDGTIPTI